MAFANIYCAAGKVRAPAHPEPNPCRQSWGASESVVVVFVVKPLTQKLLNIKNFSSIQDNSGANGGLCRCWPVYYLARTGTDCAPGIILLKVASFIRWSLSSRDDGSTTGGYAALNRGSGHTLGWNKEMQFRIQILEFMIFSFTCYTTINWRFLKQTGKTILICFLMLSAQRNPLFLVPGIKHTAQSC
jgi:hypothetical protein